MHCPECDHENRPESRFCVVCGNPLPSSCPACGAKNEPESRFCGQCGAPLAGDAATPAAPHQGLPQQAESPLAAVDTEQTHASGVRAAGSAKWRPRRLQERKGRSSGPPVWQRQRGFLAVVAGALIALLISVKMFVWPLGLWLLATKRYAALGYAAIVGVGINIVAWGALGQHQIGRYVRLMETLTRIQERRSYSLLALALGHGITTSTVVTSAAASDGLTSSEPSWPPGVVKVSTRMVTALGTTCA